MFMHLGYNSAGNKPLGTDWYGVYSPCVYQKKSIKKTTFGISEPIDLSEPIDYKGKTKTGE